MKIYEDVLVKRHTSTICDIYSNDETDACSTLTMTFGYGSNTDGKTLELDLCEQAAREILNMLWQKYGAEKIYRHMKNN